MKIYWSALKEEYIFKNDNGFFYQICEDGSQWLVGYFPPGDLEFVCEVQNELTRAPFIDAVQYFREKNAELKAALKELRSIALSIPGKGTEFASQIIDKIDEVLK